MTTLTTLVPAYKREHLADLFSGLRAQSWTDFRVVVSDDSPDSSIGDEFRRGRFDAWISRLDVTVIQGPRRGSFKNVQHLLRHWNMQTPLVHLHMDDDVLYPEFYRQHVMAHGSIPLGASVSQRWLIGPDSRPFAALPLPEVVDQQPHRVLSIGADALFATTVPACQNWLGEFSNTVLSLTAAQRLLDARLGGLSYYGLADIGVLLDVSQQLPIAFLRDHLGGFRSHPQQTTAQLQSTPLKCGYLAWAALALGAHAVGRIDEQQLRSALSITAGHCATRYPDDPVMGDFADLLRAPARQPVALRQAFTERWTRLLQSHADSRSEEQVEPVAA